MPAVKTRPRATYQPDEMTFDRVVDLVNNPYLIGHLCDKTLLTPLHSDWIIHVWDSPEITQSDSALQAHRGGYKTTAIVAVGAIRWMLTHPDDRIAIVRKTFSDAAEVVDMVGNMMKRPEIKLMFYAAGLGMPKATVDRHGLLRYNFKLTDTPEGSLTAHGLDGSLTGKHYDKIICDDIITLKDRVSKAERERTKEMIRELTTNIIDPGKYVGWIGTPWARDDGWTVIPAEPLKFPYTSTGLLSPAMIVEKKRKTTPFLFAANYELNIQTDENSLFHDPRYGHWDYALDAVAHLDAAFDGDHTCALTLMSRKGEGLQGKGWVYDGNVKDWLPEIRRICKQHKVKTLYNETNPDKGYTADALSAMGLRVYTYAESQNKHIKIATHLYEAWTTIEWDMDTQPEYMNQVLDYREGMEPDDAPDSAASLIREGLPVKSTSKALWRW